MQGAGIMIGFIFCMIIFDGNSGNFLSQLKQPPDSWWEKKKEHKRERDKYSRSGVHTGAMRCSYECAKDKRFKLRCGNGAGFAPRLSQYYFYGYFSAFCSEPAGGQLGGGSRCFTFEWQVVIYADLCSQSEPRDKSIIYYKTRPESKGSHFSIGNF